MTDVVKILVAVGPPLAAAALIMVSYHLWNEWERRKTQASNAAELKSSGIIEAQQIQHTGPTRGPTLERLEIPRLMLPGPLFPAIYPFNLGKPMAVLLFPCAGLTSQKLKMAS